MTRAPRARGSVRLEVFHHLLAAVAEEMGATLLRSSFSPNIKERRDFSCALFDAEGRMIGQAAHLPVHLGSAPLSVAAAREAVDMQRGDAVLLNDPYRGGTHLPDVTLVQPVFASASSRRPDFFCANRAHHADVGGAQPGSMAPALDVHGEGLRIPPVRLVRGGEVQREVLDLLLANMRVPAEREGDLLAQWSATRLGERRLLELCSEHGARELSRRAGELMDWTAALVRGVLRDLPDGTVRFEDELDGGARVRLALTVRGDRIELDFGDTDDELDAPLNTTRAVTLAAVFYVLRLFLPPGTPTNAGVLRPATVITRPGSLVDARYPAPVAAGNVETSQRLVDVLLGALAGLAPERVPAASAGTMSNLTFGGRGPDGEAFAYYETIAGGAGGGPEGPGEHGVHTHMTNTRNTPIEALERQLPVRVLATTLRRGSGGAGARPGGDGIEKRLRFEVDTHVAWLADRQERGPWGLDGGQPGAPGRARCALPGKAPGPPLGGRWKGTLPAGSELALETPAGGGHGALPARARRSRNPL